MENNSPLRTLYIVQLLTIVILTLLLINALLPFFGIMPVGMHPREFSVPAQKTSGYSGPASRQDSSYESGYADSYEAALALAFDPAYY